MKFSAAGIMQKIKQKYVPKTKQCRADTQPEREVRALQFKELAVTFVILGSGSALSTLAFMFEVTFAKIKNKK